MKPEEATMLVGFLKSAFPSMTEDQMRLYESGLEYEDARIASKAILDGIKEWTYTPKYAEIVERMRMFARADAMAAPRPPQEQAVPPPFWVKRWLVARYITDPPDHRIFREEDSRPEGTPDPPQGWMPEDAYVEEAANLTAEQMSKALGASLGIKP